MRVQSHLTKRRLDCHPAAVNVYFANPSVESQIVESEISGHWSMELPRPRRASVSIRTSYCVTKAGIVSLVKSMALDLALPSGYVSTV